jgi:hypothetical protein
LPPEWLGLQAWASSAERDKKTRMGSFHTYYFSTVLYELNISPQDTQFLTLLLFWVWSWSGSTGLGAGEKGRVPELKVKLRFHKLPDDLHVLSSLGSIALVHGALNGPQSFPITYFISPSRGFSLSPNSGCFRIWWLFRHWLQQGYLVPLGSERTVRRSVPRPSEWHCRGSASHSWDATVGPPPLRPSAVPLPVPSPFSGRCLPSLQPLLPLLPRPHTWCRNCTPSPSLLPALPTSSVPSSPQIPGLSEEKALCGPGRGRPSLGRVNAPCVPALWERLQWLECHWVERRLMWQREC